MQFTSKEPLTECRCCRALPFFIVCSTKDDVMLLRIVPQLSSFSPIWKKTRHIHFRFIAPSSHMTRRAGKSTRITALTDQLTPRSRYVEICKDKKPNGTMNGCCIFTLRTLVRPMVAEPFIARGSPFLKRWANVLVCRHRLVSENIIHELIFV